MPYSEIAFQEHRVDLAASRVFSEPSTIVLGACGGGI